MCLSKELYQNFICAGYGTKLHPVVRFQFYVYKTCRVVSAFQLIPGPF